MRLDPAAPHLNVKMDGTPLSAIQCANLFTLFKVTTLAGVGGEPRFIEGERPYWIVPLRMTLPSTGPLGIIGEVRIDASTGEALADADEIGRMIDNSNRLAERALSSTGADRRVHGGIGSDGP